MVRKVDKDRVQKVSKPRVKNNSKKLVVETDNVVKSPVKRKRQSLCTCDESKCDCKPSSNKSKTKKANISTLIESLKVGLGEELTVNVVFDKEKGYSKIVEDDHVLVVDGSHRVVGEVVGGNLCLVSETGLDLCIGKRLQFDRLRIVGNVASNEKDDILVDQDDNGVDEDDDIAEDDT